MLNVILTIHLLACTAMVGVIMLQRSEGGVQGLSGGGTGGIISGRGAASVLVRTTMICALIFFCTSLVMTRLNSDEGQKPDDFKQELQKVNSGANILGTSTPSAAPSAAPTPTGPDPLAAVTPAPTGLVTGGPSILTAPTTAAPSPGASAAAPTPKASTPAAPRPSASSPAATPSTSPAPGGSPQ